MLLPTIQKGGQQRAGVELLARSARSAVVCLGVHGMSSP